MTEAICQKITNFRACHNRLVGFKHLRPDMLLHTMWRSHLHRDNVQKQTGSMIQTQKWGWLIESWFPCFSKGLLVWIQSGGWRSCFETRLRFDVRPRMCLNKFDTNIISTRGIIKWHPGPYEILVGALNNWNDRRKVVPWQILFEQVVPKRLTNHP